MKIEKDRVVRFHYSRRRAGAGAAGKLPDNDEPLAILIGHGNIIPGLEKAMEGRRPATTSRPTWRPPMPTARGATA